MLKADVQTTVLGPINDGAPFGFMAMCSPLATSFLKPKHRVIGGVGRTLRWVVTATDHSDSEPVILLLSNVTGNEHDLIVATYGLPDWLQVCISDVEVDEEDDEYGTCATLYISDARCLLQVVAHLHQSVSFSYIVEDTSRERLFEFGVERFDRSRWNFYNQTEVTAAPKQSWHKWTFDWMPSDWKVLPFTWARLCANLDALDPMSAPSPLCHHLVTFRIACAESALETGSPDMIPPAPTPACSVKSTSDPREVLEARRRMWKRTLPTQRHVTSSLTDAQAEELLLAMYVIRYVGQPESRLEAAYGTMRDYIMHGYTARIFGPYRQEARHVGHGRTNRKFKTLSQYQPQNLSIRVLNGMYQLDGSLKGRGMRTQTAGRGGRGRGRGRIPVAKRAPRSMTNDARYHGRLLSRPESVFTIR